MARSNEMDWAKVVRHQEPKNAYNNESSSNVVSSSSRPGWEEPKSLSIATITRVKTNSKKKKNSIEENDSHVIIQQQQQVSVIFKYK